MTRVRVVVPSERHVQRARERGEDAETRDALRARLVAALVADVFAGAGEVRVALGEALPEVAREDALLAPLLREGGATWTRTVAAIDAAIGVLRGGMVDDAILARVPMARAKTLVAATRALDAALARVGRVDARCAPARLAKAIGEIDPERVRDAVGADAVVARWIVAWDAADAAWWSALDAALRRAGGGATIELAAIDAPLDADRERAPLEIVADDLARVLDDSPRLVAIAAPLGDLSMAKVVPVDAIELCRASDARAQARAAVHAVRTAIAAGTRVDAIAIGVPAMNDETLLPLCDALEEAEIAFDARVAERSGLVACALDALSVARGLARRDVAALLRSRYLDVGALGDARALAKALDDSASARGDDPVAALEATVRASAPALASFARAIGETLARADGERTRAAHADAARELWRALGIRAVERGADARRSGADARGWAALGAALDAVVASAGAVGAGARAISAEAFRRELVDAIEVPPRPPRAGLRVVALAELAGEPLDLVVVVDANDGVLASGTEPDPFVGDAMIAKLRDRARAAPAPGQVRRARAGAELVMAASGAKRIVFVDREVDDAATLLAPAPIVAWLARAGAKVTRWSASPLAGPPTNAHEAKLRALASPEDAERIAPEAARRARVERERESLFESASPAPSETRGRLARDDSRASILASETGAGHAMSVTALERIAACPFQGFASQVLRARAPAVVSELPDAREAGEIVHDALAHVFDATAELWRARPRDRASIETRARAACDDFLARAPSASSLRRIALDRVRADVAAVVAWSLADDAWDFAHAEKSFGAPNDEWPAVVIDDGVVRIALRGTIDRVDVAHDARAVRAIDYKSSAATALDAGKRLGETTFQVAIYARAAARGAAEIAGLYLPARARALAEHRASRAHDEAWKRAHADAGGRAAIDVRALDVVRALRSGDVMPRPYAEAACTRCDLDGGCRKPRFAIQTDDEEAP